MAGENTLSRRVAKNAYDFAVDGGTVGTIALRGDTVPSGAIVVNALIRVITPVTSGGAGTLAIQVESAADVQAAAAVSGAPWSTAGAKRGSALTATTAGVITTANRTPSAVIATAALTAGKFVVYTYYDIEPTG